MILYILTLLLLSCMALFVSLLLKETWHMVTIIDLNNLIVGNGAVPGLENISAIFILMLFYSSIILIFAISIKVIKNNW